MKFLANRLEKVVLLVQKYYISTFSHVSTMHQSVIDLIQAVFALLYTIWLRQIIKIMLTFEAVKLHSMVGMIFNGLVASGITFCMLILVRFEGICLIMSYTLLF
jgi:hypothetical protein